MSSSACSLEPLISHFDISRPVDWNKYFPKKGALTVEIGFGLGEVLTKNALSYDHNNFIGIEMNWERIYKTLNRFEREGVTKNKNARILCCDATAAFERLFKERTVDACYCLFPCPWPKKKHEKFRLFSSSSLRLINSRLKDKATFRIVTDYFPYVQWIEGEVGGSGFTFSFTETTEKFDTKFENKWRKEGQDTFFEIELKKKKHTSVKVKRDKVMKNYKLSSFDPSKFELKEYKGKVTVIPRYSIYDNSKNTMMIHTIVAEENLTQDFWATILKGKNGWILKRSEGHYFFPTPGIVQALKVIYEAAKKCAT